MYDLAEIVPLTYSVVNASNQAVNASTVTLTIGLPDGTTATPAVDNPPTVTGTYALSYVPAMAGHYTVRWTTSGPTTAGTDSFDVQPAASYAILSLADAKQHLNIPAATTTYDDELRVYLDAVTEAVEGIIGPVIRRPVTETVYPSSGVLLLSTTPVLSITSITPYAGVALGAGTYTVTPSGIVMPATYGVGFYAARYDVVYVAGRALVPAAVNLAARIILSHLWETQRGPADSAFAPADEVGGLVPGFGFAIPRRAEQLLAQYTRAPGVA